MDEDVGKTSEDDQEDQDSLGPRVMVMPHKLGGIAVVVRGVDGTVTEGRLNINEAALVQSHLQALVTMAFGTAYTQAAQQEEQLRSSGLFVPGRK